ncbi:MAG: L-2-amino-thiazoline-4-carboxylic acid hydrolase [archaeon GB-1845-036]|nr:L-2-amino-thiazoline-4-carboxylic acid hydrolase [Candidatus Culexmicrobium thermophilum]HDO21139.1 hypothetical protein [Candidatus Bathyarchaeota archaeon]
MKEKVITVDECEKQVKLAVRLMGLLYYHFAKVLIDELGEKEGKRLISLAIKNFGLDRGKMIREKALKLGLKLTPESFNKFSDLPKLGWGGMDRKSFCPLAEVWFEKNAVELGKLYCDVDIYKYRGFNPKIKIKRVKWVLEGDEICKYHVTLQ